MIKVSLTQDHIDAIERYFLLQDKLKKGESLSQEEQWFIDLYEKDKYREVKEDRYNTAQEKLKEDPNQELQPTFGRSELSSHDKEWFQNYIKFKVKEQEGQELTDEETHHIKETENYAPITALYFSKYLEGLNTQDNIPETDINEDTLSTEDNLSIESTTDGGISEEQPEVDEAVCNQDDQRPTSKTSEDIKTTFNAKTGILSVSGILKEDVNLTKEDVPNFKGVDFLDANLKKTKSITLPKVEDESFSFTAGDTIKPKLNFKEVHGVKNMDIKVDREGLKKITLPDNLKELKLTLPQKPSDDFEILGDWKNLKKLDLSECHEAMLTDEFLNKIKEENPKLKIILPQNSEEYQSENDGEIRITTQPVQKPSLLNRLINRRGR